MTAEVVDAPAWILKGLDWNRMLAGGAQELLETLLFGPADHRSCVSVMAPGTD